jgi:hypothetical protein
LILSIRILIERPQYTNPFDCDHRKGKVLHKRSSARKATGKSMIHVFRALGR